MWNTGDTHIQLGNAGGGLNANDYIDALRYSLSSGPVSDFARMNGNEQIDYLKNKVIVGSAYLGEDKGDTAKGLRELLHISDSKDIQKTSVLDNLLKNSFEFMNDNLRDFMNLNNNGSTVYDYRKLEGFTKLNILQSLYHLDPYYEDVEKYVDGYGREVVFGRNKITENFEQINSEVYRGTYNYADAQMRNAINRGAHYIFDMSPFKEKYPNATIPNILLANVTNEMDITYNRIINYTYGISSFFNTLPYKILDQARW
jgi:hypothetical protein